MNSAVYFFDLDGTILDTFKATKFAYEAAGLLEYKQEYWGKPAHEWGCPLYVHRKKKRTYKSFLHLVQEGWAYEEYVKHQDTAIILTGASMGTVNALREKTGLPLRTLFGTCLSNESKARILKRVADHGHSVFYYDDHTFEVDPRVRFITRSERCS